MLFVYSLSKELSENGVLARAARQYPQRGHSRPTHASKPSIIMTGHITPCNQYHIHLTFIILSMNLSLIDGVMSGMLMV
jgi:hypothetical protein